MQCTYLDKQGIVAKRTNTYTPEQNDVSESLNIAAMDCLKSMLNASGLNEKFWAEALMCFTYV